MRAERQKGAADQPGPEGVWLSQGEAPVEDLELVGGRGTRDDLVEPAGQTSGQDDHRQKRSGVVDDQLDQIRPEDGSHPTEEGVRRRRQAEHNDRVGQGDAGDFLQHDRGEEEPQPVCQ